MLNSYKTCARSILDNITCSIGLGLSKFLIPSSPVRDGLAYIATTVIACG